MLAVLAPTMPTQTGCGGSNVPIPSHDSWADDCSTQRGSVEAEAVRVAQQSASGQEKLQCLQATTTGLEKRLLHEEGVISTLKLKLQRQQNLTSTLFQQLCTERAASIELQEWLQRALATKEQYRKAILKENVRL